MTSHNRVSKTYRLDLAVVGKTGTVKSYTKSRGLWKFVSSKRLPSMLSHQRFNLSLGTLRLKDGAILQDRGKLYWAGTCEGDLDSGRLCCVLSGNLGVPVGQC